MIEREAGRSIPEIFAAEGEAGFRARERAAVAGARAGGPGPARAAASSRPAAARRSTRAIAGGCTAGASAVWLDGAARGRSPSGSDARPNVRPLIAGRDPIGRAARPVGRDASGSTRAAHRLNGVAEIRGVVEAVERLIAAPGRRTGDDAPRRRDAASGGSCSATGIAGRGARRGAAPPRGARGRSSSRSPGRGARSASRSSRRRWRRPGCRSTSCCCRRARRPSGCPWSRTARVSSPGSASSAASRSSRSAAVRSATRPGSSRRRTCAACRSSTSRRRSSPRSTRRSAARPRSICPRARTSSGRSTSRRTSIIDVAFLATLPERQRRAALGEAVKMAVLGDERLFELLEADGEAIAAGPTRGVRARGRRRGRRTRAPGPRSRSSWPTSRARAPAVADRPQPGPLARPRARGGRRVRGTPPRRGGGIRVAGGCPDRTRRWA